MSGVKLTASHLAFHKIKLGKSAYFICVDVIKHNMYTKRNRKVLKTRVLGGNIKSQFVNLNSDINLHLMHWILFFYNLLIAVKTNLLKHVLVEQLKKMSHTQVPLLF